MKEKELLRRIERAAAENATVLTLSFRVLTFLPQEIGRLTNLTKLILPSNQLTSLPSELSQLINLTELNLQANQLTSLPAELGQLANLTVLDLQANQLASLPAELGQLANLTVLDLQANQLASVPAELGQLTNLTRLWLDDNQLTSLPSELSQLINLRQLSLPNNQLKSVPAKLGRLRNLTDLRLDGNKHLTSPPPEVVKQGTKAVLAYLRGQFKEHKKQWVSKVLVVGEGGVGKTSLLRSLREEEFVEGLSTTHGIGFDKLQLEHPSQADVTMELMELNTWDFGGQQIYHATHQFFLTNRSLFVLVWDARHGWEAGKLYNWLDRIQARAPDSPVMIVAAHIDERDADLPLDDLQRKYPQIRGHYKISNKDGTGIDDFRKRLAEVSADLPLMGEEWPADWLAAANEIRSLKDSYISPKKLGNLLAKHNVKGDSAGVLSQWLHELGDMLYFKEDEELNDLVILNPHWVSEAISDVLESEEVIEKKGILTRQHGDQIWSDISQSIRGHLLRLMEKFDLSYRTLENQEISLVVERLPLDPPDYEREWDVMKKEGRCKEISMKFELGSMQAGLPTWFIARSHRFTTHTHWRMGALFADGKEKRHMALVQAYPHGEFLKLTVRGSMPYNFFALLRDGLELTLARFPGLKIRRTIPCPGHDGRKCKHEFDVEQLEGAFKENVSYIPCPETGFKETVSVPEMLFGLHTDRYDSVLRRMEEMEAKLVAGHDEILTASGELTALAQRGFTSLFNAQQTLAESHCPNVFAVLPKEGRWSDKLLGQKMVMQLFCQAPGHWHQVVKGAKGGRYEIKKPAAFFKSMGPYILKLAELIKYAAPVGGAAVGVAAAGPGGAVMGAATAKNLAGQIKLMEELAKKLADRSYQGAELLERTGVGGKAERIEGMELRALRTLLDKEDPAHEWGGLKKVLTPEGHYLWLCEDHAAEYRV